MPQEFGGSGYHRATEVEEGIFYTKHFLVPSPFANVNVKTRKKLSRTMGGVHLSTGTVALDYGTIRSVCAGTSLLYALLTQRKRPAKLATTNFTLRCKEVSGSQAVERRQITRSNFARICTQKSGNMKLGATLSD